MAHAFDSSDASHAFVAGIQQRASREPDHVRSPSRTVKDAYARTTSATILCKSAGLLAFLFGFTGQLFFAVLTAFAASVLTCPQAEWKERCRGSRRAKRRIADVCPSSSEGWGGTLCGLNSWLQSLDLARRQFQINFLSCGILRSKVPSVSGTPGRNQAIGESSRQLCPWP